MNRLIATSSILLLLAAAASADLVTGKWGMDGLINHPKTLKVDGQGGGSTLTFDLADLPKGTNIYRARLIFTSGNGYEVACKEKPLALAGPYFLWFDATDAVRASAGDGNVSFVLKRANSFKPNAAILEIAYEGQLKDPPAQVTEMKAWHRSGQVFMTFKEIDDFIAGGKDITWGDVLKKTVSGCTPLGIIPIDKDREIRYHVYAHTEPITPKNIAQATFVHEVRPGSGYIEEHVATSKVGEQGASFVVTGQGIRRVMIDKGTNLPPGYGFHWHTANKPGKLWYAVVTSVNGLENTADISDKNAAGPFDVQVMTPEPMLYAEKVTKVRGAKGDAQCHDEMYSWWLPPPLSPYPKRYDLQVTYCPETMEKPCCLEITRGHAWIENPEPPGPGAYAGVFLAPTSDSPNVFFMGINDMHYTLKDWAQGKWAPHPHMRAEALIKWLKGKFPIDEQRIVGSIGCWGMMEIERGDIYNYLHGWGEPELTKGFQAWSRAQGGWGPREVYANRPKEENPWIRQDYSTWVLENPAKELPYFQMHMGWGAHFTEMGWPPFPRFYRAMMDTKRAFCSNAPAVGDAISKGTIKILRDQSLPALGNCSLDQNPGSGDLRGGDGMGSQINAYLLWETAGIVDGPEAWEMTIWLDGGAPQDSCTVDITPRRCQKFKAAPGQKFKYEITVAQGKVLASGAAEADKFGLVTIVKAPIAKAKCRVKISQ